MAARFKLVTLAILALFTSGLRAPSLPSLEPGSDGEEQVTAYRPASLPALAPARHSRGLEAARKAPFLAVLSCAPLLGPSLSYGETLDARVEQPRTRPLSPRTSRGPPAIA